MNRIGGSGGGGAAAAASFKLSIISCVELRVCDFNTTRIAYQRDAERGYKVIAQYNFSEDEHLIVIYECKRVYL